jgi:hypothetical protein
LFGLDARSAGTSGVAAPPELQEIGDEVVELRVGNGLAIEGRHGTEATADLEGDEPARQRLVVDREGEARLATRMAVISLRTDPYRIRWLRGQSPSTRPHLRRGAFYKVEPRTMSGDVLTRR